MQLNINFGSREFSLTDYICLGRIYFAFLLGTLKHTSGESFCNPFLKAAAALGVCVYIVDTTYRQNWVKAIWSKHSVLWPSLPAELCLPNASKCPAEGSDVEWGRFSYHCSTHYFMSRNTLRVEEDFSFEEAARRITSHFVCLLSGDGSCFRFDQPHWKEASVK